MQGRWVRRAQEVCDAGVEGARRRARVLLPRASGAKSDDRRHNDVVILVRVDGSVKYGNCIVLSIKDHAVGTAG